MITQTKICLCRINPRRFLEIIREVFEVDLSAKYFSDNFELIVSQNNRPKITLDNAPFTFRISTLIFELRLGRIRPMRKKLLNRENHINGDNVPEKLIEMTPKPIWSESSICIQI